MQHFEPWPLTARLAFVQILINCKSLSLSHGPASPEAAHTSLQQRSSTIWENGCLSPKTRCNLFLARNWSGIDARSRRSEVASPCLGIRHRLEGDRGRGARERERASETERLPHRVSTECLSPRVANEQSSHSYVCQLTPWTRRDGLPPLHGFRSPIAGLRVFSGKPFSSSSPSPPPLISLSLFSSSSSSSSSSSLCCVVLSVHLFVIKAELRIQRARACFYCVCSRCPRCWSGQRLVVRNPSPVFIQNNGLVSGAGYMTSLFACYGAIRCCRLPRMSCGRKSSRSCNVHMRCPRRSCVFWLTVAVTEWMKLSCVVEPPPGTVFCFTAFAAGWQGPGLHLLPFLSIWTCVCSRRRRLSAPMSTNRNNDGFRQFFFAHNECTRKKRRVMALLHFIHHCFSV